VRVVVIEFVKTYEIMKKCRLVVGNYRPDYDSQTEKFTVAVTAFKPLNVTICEMDILMGKK